MSNSQISVNAKNKTTIQRGKHNKENPYVMISKNMLRDKALSIKQRGVLCYLLSLPDNWVTHPAHIAKELGINKGQMYAILQQLIINGYAKKEENKDAKGRFSGVSYFFYEEKISISKDPELKNPCDENPCTENPYTDNPCTEIWPILNNDLKEDIYKTNNTSSKVSKTYEPKEEAAFAAAAYAAESECENLPDIPKKVKGPTAYSPQVKDLSHRMITLLSSHSSDYRPPDNLASFLKHVNLLMEKDKRDPERIIEVLDWALQDNEERGDFKGWSSVIYSKNPAETLRKHFNKLAKQMDSKPKKKERKFAPSSDDAKALEIINRMDETAI